MRENATGILQPAADFGHERREVFQRSVDDTHFIGMTLHLPVTGSRPQAAALLLPGWTGPRTGPAELLVFLARELTRNACVVLRIDFQGRGDASGSFGDCDLDRMIREAEAGLNVLKSRFPDVPRAVGGICSGANVALGLASLRPSDVPAVLAFSVLPFQPARTAAFDRRRRWKSLKQYAIKALRPATWLKLIRGEVHVGRVKENLTTTEKPREGERNLRDSSRDIEQELLSWKGRALFVWGGGDDEAPPAQAHYEKLHAAGLAREVRWHLIPAANHNFYARTWREEVAREALAFIPAG